MANLSNQPTQPDALANARITPSAAISEHYIDLLKTDIHNAAKTVAGIRETFKVIGSLIYASKFEGKDELQASWTTADGLYYDTVQECQASATKLATRAQEFSGVLRRVVSQDFNMQIKGKFTANYIKGVEESQDKLASLSARLNGVTSALEDFEAPLKKIKTQGKSKAKEGIDTARSEIEALESELESIDAEITELTSKLEAGASGVARLIGTIRMLVFAIFMLTTDDCSAELEKHRESREAKIKQIRTKKAALDKLQNTLEDPLVQINSRYQQLRSEYRSGISESIKAFEAIQQGLASEAQEVHKWLTSPDPTFENAPVVVRAYNTTHASVFSVIGEALSRYNVTAATG